MKEYSCIVRSRSVRKEWLLELYPCPLLLLGPPGVGKSETVRGLAERLAEQTGMRFVELDYGNANVEDDNVFLFYDLRLSEVEPSDLIGIPRDSDGWVSFKPLRWAVLLSRHPGVLFLDELTNVQRDDVMTAAYKILYDRRVGEVRLHDGVWVIAAGNRPEDSAVARLLPAPLMNRMIRVDFEAPKLNEWVTYMDSMYGNWDRRTLAYLERFPDDFLRPPMNSVETLENFPTPRSWTIVATKLPTLKSEEAVKALCEGVLGRDVGKKFLMFIDNPVPSPEEVVANPDIYVSLSLDQRYIFAVSFSQWVASSIKRVRHALPFLKYLASNDREILVFILVSLNASFRSRFIDELISLDRGTFFPLLREVASWTLENRY